MPLSDSARLVKHAAKNNYAVAMINTNGATYDIVRAITEVAEEEKAPVILGGYQDNLNYRGFEYAANVMNFFAQKAAVPIATHLDHGRAVAACQEAIEAGFTSVMFDGSERPIDENIAMTKEVVALAKRKAVSVEAEIGELQKLGPDGQIEEVKNLADREEVERMSQETEIDMLAVGIGNAHGFYKGKPHIRVDLLEEFKNVCRVPLVLHGTTGLEDDVVRRCIELGIAKINLGTLIRANCVKYTADVIAAGEHKNHPWRVGQTVKDRLKDDIRKFIRLIGSSGKAEELVI